jgi:lipopolysaccharide transport system ATP-binding protein
MMRRGMTQPIIEFQSVSKRYRKRRHRAFRDFFVRSGQRTASDAEFWALREVDFAIQPGESVGLIGPNGAGKSTALKLISGVTAPNAGQVVVRGRVGALLELGAGFHPELSGRDNVYLNAALLGLGRSDIARKFDSIVGFSELAEFIDTPVKHYSSGMFMRLAFAVNIHVEPEILLVDEVLAVGDYNFQKKCLDRINELKRNGVTIFLVSHSHDMIREHCTRALWLDHGRLIADGAAEPVIVQYLDRALAAEAARLSAGANGPRSRWGSRKIEITGVRLTDEAGNDKTIFATHDPLVVHIAYRAHEAVPPPVFGVGIHRQDGVHITGPNTGFARFDLPALAGSGAITFHVLQLPLLEGAFAVSVSVHPRDDTEMYDFHDRLYLFRVVNRQAQAHEKYGLVTLRGDWAHRPAA